MPNLHELCQAQKKCKKCGIKSLHGNILGRSWKHACSMRLMFKRGEFFDEDGNTLTKSAESPAGHVIQVAVLKTKVCKWDRKLGSMTLNYVKGVDILQDTIIAAIHLGLIDNSVQGTYKVIDLNTGEIMLDEEGNEIKIRGKKNLNTYFKENPKQWKKLYDAVYEKLTKKDDPYVKGFEEMLGTTINEVFGMSEDTDLEEL